MKISKKFLDSLGLEGKNAIITGASSGIGKEISILLSEMGVNVTLLDINERGGIELEREIIKNGGIAKFIKCDVSSSKDCKKSVEETIKNFGKIDILCNNAGIIIRKNVVELTEEEWDRVIYVNLKSIFLMSHYTIPHMIENGGGCIINIGSGWALKGGPSAVAYCASKAGVLNMTRAMAIDHGKQNIRVNCVCPGDTDTPMLHEESKQVGEDFEKFLKEVENRPIKRIGRPEDIGYAVFFLVSNLSSWVTGTCLIVDGGGLA
ncbi:MAG: SDR family NAD(P)-dependent oxidoreductase [Candidatus Aminicenantia bacterium]